MKTIVVLCGENSTAIESVANLVWESAYDDYTISTFHADSAEWANPEANSLGSHDDLDKDTTKQNTAHWRDRGAAITMFLCEPIGDAGGRCDSAKFTVLIQSQCFVNIWPN